MGAETAHRLTPPTLAWKLSAVGHYHRLAGQVQPQKAPGSIVVSTTMADVQRLRVTPVAINQAAASGITLIMLSSIEGTGERLADLRERALLSFGMASAMRRSDLIALDVADLQIGTNGVRVIVRRAKTDQKAASAVIANPDGGCPKPVDHPAQCWSHQA